MGDAGPARLRRDEGAPRRLRRPQVFYEAERLYAIQRGPDQVQGSDARGDVRGQCAGDGSAPQRGPVPAVKGLRGWTLFFVCFGAQMVGSGRGVRERYLFPRAHVASEPVRARASEPGFVRNTTGAKHLKK